MQKALIPALLLIALSLPATSAHAFDGCRAVDFNEDGVVNLLDVSLFGDLVNNGSLRSDLDGGGTFGNSDVQADIDILISFLDRTCTDCTADLDDDGDVDAADRAIVAAAIGTNCRSDLTRDDVGDQHDVDLFFEYFQRAGPITPNSPEARADMNGDGVLDLLDVGPFTANLSNDCRVDLNKDGAVDTNDIWALLASWGSCP